MPFRPEVTRGFQPFLCAPGEAPLTVSLLPVQALPEVRGRELLRNYAFAVFRTEDGFFRVFHDRREGDRPYAVGHLEQDGRETIEYLEADRGFFSETANCFSHIALEALLLQRDAMILHASFVSTRYGGLLFSGVSGIGKSTQADLWQRYEGAELLNGDRTVLRRMDGVWTAFGSPYAGSSNCFVNESRPVRAIVLLSQAGILVKLNCSLTPHNACDLERIVSYAAERDLILEVNTYMFPPLRRDPAMVGRNDRFTPAETAHYHMERYRLQRGEEDFTRFLQNILRGIAPPPGLDEDCVDPVDGTISCRAGNASFWVTWDGWLTPCGMMPKPRIELKGKPFREAWSELTRVSAAQRLSGTCTGCQNRRICHSCAAMAMAETGSVSGIPKYLCEMVWAMRTEAARLLAERQKPTT